MTPADEGDRGAATESASPVADNAVGGFAFFSLTGDRFNAPGMPVDSAREVGYFRQAVLELARRLWLDSNIGRQRVPSGFNEAFDLRLTEVRRGSSQPQMLLHRAPRISDDEWAEWVRYYESARDRLTDAIASINDTEALPVNFPAEAKSALRRVGSSLGDSESITLGSPVDNDARAVLDRTARDIIEDIEDVPIEPQLVRLEGVIVEYDSVASSFRLLTNLGISTCELGKADASIALAAKRYLSVNGLDAPDVQIEGLSRNASRRVPKLIQVSSITQLRSVIEKVLLRQLRAIEELNPGWMGANSRAPSQEIIGRAQMLIPALAGESLTVSIVPNIDGCIVLEYRTGPFELSVILEPDDEMYLCSDNVETNELHEEQMSFDPGKIIKFLLRGTVW